MAAPFLGVAATFLRRPGMSCDSLPNVLMTKRMFGVVDGRGRRVGATRLETVATWGLWWFTDGAGRPDDPAGAG